MLGAYPTDPLGAQADPTPGIEAWREGFRSVGPRTFDRGGEVGRRFHLDAAVWLEMATIARTALVRSLRLSLRPKVAEAEVQLPDRRARFAWSVSKVQASTALGALVGKEEVDPERDVANMASGMNCLDADGYQTRTTCIHYHLEEALGIPAPTGYEDGLLAHLQAMTRRGPAGTRNEYVSANTVVLGLVLEAVTGQPFARAVRELLWGPHGRGGRRPDGDLSGRLRLHEQRTAPRAARSRPLRPALRGTGGLGPSTPPSSRSCGRRRASP